MSKAATSGWRELMTPQALPRFALICLGTWLTAADTLVTVTMMPTVAREIGGYAWFGWTVAAFVLGSILAGATSGRLSQRIGLRHAMVLGGLAYALGCALSALAPNIEVFLIGRGLQGIGGGWVSGLSYVAVTALFPERLWARLLSALAGVWGVATLSSPLIGGLFAEAGFWRGGFWLFAVQGLLFCVAAVVLVSRAAGAAPSPGRLPVRSLAALSFGIAGLAAAGVAPDGLWMMGLTVAGVLLLGLFLRLNGREEAGLLPRRAGVLASGEGSGFLMVFCFCAATCNLAVYGPALMQGLHGATPVEAGYTICLEAMGWTLAAFTVSGRPATADSGPIRLGALLICAGLLALTFTVPRGPLILIAACAFLQGSGFGLAWALASSRMVAAAPEHERAVASSAIPTMQLIGNAVGAAACALIANRLGYGEGAAPNFTVTVALFAAFLPVAGVGAFAAWRLSSPAFARADEV